MDRHPTKCKARRTDGQPCGRYPRRGASVCPAHGGSAPQVRAAAAERVLDEKLRDTLARLGTVQGTPVDNPLAALALLAGQVLAFKDAVGELVNELREIRFTDSKGGEQLRSEVAMYERALDRSMQVLVAMARLKLDERLVAVSEAQAEMLVRAVDAGLAAAGLTGEAREPAKRAVAAQLRIISSGGGVGGGVA
jgi:hypothetical protein